jgi:hypothetical protein
MLKVQSVADSYGVSTAFLVRALAQMGFKDAQADTLVPTVILTRFEARYGARIQAKRPPAPVTRRFSSSNQVRPPAQVMRVAHGRVGAGRDSAGNREKRLLPDPGPVHAIDLTGTWDGDRWKGEVVPGAVHFFGGAMNTGPRAACGRMHMRAVLGDEFVPDEDDPVKAGQCPKCAELVAEGKGFRSPPGSYDPFCHAFLHVKINGQVETQNCKLTGHHRGVHRTRDGATWNIGFDDFVPAPLDAGCRIAEAS